jgi:hypothetical protein
VLRTGRAWRHSPASGRYPQPHDFTVGWSAAHKHFLRWCRTGIWTPIPTAIRGEARTRGRRRRRPTTAVPDPSSVKASPAAGPRGFDGAKKVDGVKRHLLVDAGGILIAALVTPATMQNRAAFPHLMRQAKRIAPTITHVWVDKGYTGTTVADAATNAGAPPTSCPGPNPDTGSSSNRAAGWSNPPTAGSTTAAAPTAITKSTPPPTKASSSSAKSRCYSDDSTDPNLFDTL